MRLNKKPAAQAIEYMRLAAHQTNQAIRAAVPAGRNRTPIRPRAIPSVAAASLRIT
jgi:hypothetical protein